jgi:hypothetical protein
VDLSGHPVRGGLLAFRGGRQVLPLCAAVVTVVTAAAAGVYAGPVLEAPAAATA